MTIRALKSGEEVIGWVRKGTTFRIGDTVRLRGDFLEASGRAKITRILPRAYEDGVVELDGLLDFGHRWNVEDLAKVRVPSATK